MAAVLAENGTLRGELLRGLVLTAEGGLLGKPLSWRALPGDPGLWAPEPRSRHSTLLLKGLQVRDMHAHAFAMHACMLVPSTAWQ